MLVDREVWSCLSKFYKSNYLVDREVWSALVKFLQVQLPGRPGSLVYTCEIFTSPTTWSTGKSPSERSLLSLLLAAWPAGAGEVGAAHFFWSLLKLSLRLTALGSRPDLAGRPGVLAGGRLQPVRTAETCMFPGAIFMIYVVMSSCQFNLQCLIISLSKQARVITLICTRIIQNFCRGGQRLTVKQPQSVFYTI